MRDTDVDTDTTPTQSSPTPPPTAPSPLPYSSSPGVRQPRQQRTRQQWNRVLDAGLELLETGGYPAFTIAALCDRAGVPPRALYARVDTKEALFLAVYEHGAARVTASEASLDDPGLEDLSPHQRVDRVVRHLVGIFVEHAEFLRAVVLISGTHPEVRRRGEVNRNELSARFVRALGQPGLRDPTGPVDARAFCFSLIFSAMVVRAAYGPGFGPGTDIETTAAELVTMAQRYLLHGTS